MASLKSLFSKDGRKARQIEKNCARAADYKIKPSDRRPALEVLFDDGSAEALGGLMKRFTFNYTLNQVADEDEKDYIYQGLVAIGPPLLVPLQSHLKTSPVLSWGLRLLEEIFDEHTQWKVVDELLQDYEPGYERDPSKKLQLLNYVGRMGGKRATKVLLPYLEDHDENVRYTVIEAAFSIGDESAREPLLEMLISESDDVSLRLKNRIAEGFAETGWVVKGYRGGVEKMLSSEFLLDGKGKIKRKKARV